MLRKFHLSNLNLKLSICGKMVRFSFLCARACAWVHAWNYRTTCKLVWEMDYSNQTNKYSRTVD